MNPSPHPYKQCYNISYIRGIILYTRYSQMDWMNMVVDVVERAQRWEAFDGSWSEFVKAEQPRRDGAFECALYRARFRNQSPEFTAHQSARTWFNIKRRRSAKSK